MTPSSTHSSLGLKRALRSAWPDCAQRRGAQYTSVAFTQRLIDEGVDPSVGSVGDALDNALAETTVGSFKNELIHRQGPWRDVSQVELATAEWVDWFNTERPHDYLDDFTPAAVEALHYDHRHTHRRRGDSRNQSPDLPGRLNPSGPVSATPASRA
ncbi:hypothetical protein MALGJ_46220 [Mycolicibacter algericus]|uniref:Integrase catalytic domain-containing protein n=1 Tax=Mycolicibacter algericus TaxID=1288388 RepID=A0A7I9YGX9_MYCAL|nr:hypothetical protein MALGJ_46220 [Mycolicibacter algericus]